MAHNPAPHSRGAGSCPEVPVSTNSVGRIVWHDLTVADAPRLREFYERVMGWSNMPIAMKDDTGDYADYVMLAPEGSEPPAVRPRRRP